MTTDCCRPAAEAPRASVGGSFELTDHDGARVDASSFGDRWLLVFFGFTHCRIVCPRELAKIDAALQRLGERAARIQPLYVTVDPERDDPPTMRAYLRQHPAFVGLTGTRDEIDAVKQRFRVFARKTDDADAPGGYVVPHTAIAYLAAPGGRVVDHFGDALDAERLAERLRPYVEAGCPPK